MTQDATGPGPGRATGPAAVRSAAAAVTAALERHLRAVEERSGESDQQVYEAFRDLREALVAYDTALYEAYDEVAPYDVVDHGEPASEGMEVDDEAHDVRNVADSFVASLEVLLDTLDEGEPPEVADEAQELVEGGLGSLLAAIESVYGRRIQPFLPPPDWGEEPPR